ncbi:MAG: glyoxalase [Holophagaceae bacterium]|nr:glyoxalase [Holophagaceae bacterium]
MKRVVGIGGIFIKAADPVALRDWYQRHLGVDVQDWGGAVFPNDRPGGMTVWNLFPETTDYFSPSRAGFMVNYVVEDLDGVLAALRAEGCDVDSKVEDSDFGRFGWVMDPEGNRVELWQPPSGPSA